MPDKSRPVRRWQAVHGSRHQFTVRGSGFRVNREIEYSPRWHEGREEPRIGANEREGRIHHRDTEFTERGAPKSPDSESG